MSKTTKSKTATRAKKAAAPKTTTQAKPRTRLDQLQDLLMRPKGASIAEMMEATGWQSHSIRGAMAGALKKRGLNITSERKDKVRRYHAETPA